MANLREEAALTVTFLERKLGEYEALRAEIADLEREARLEGGVGSLADVKGNVNFRHRKINVVSQDDFF